MVLSVLNQTMSFVLVRNLVSESSRKFSEFVVPTFY